jgi:hypothetical protein
MVRGRSRLTQRDVVEAASVGSLAAEGEVGQLDLGHGIGLLSYRRRSI